VDLGSLEEVAEKSDILTINCPLNEETKGIISADILSAMKPTAYLINTARGPIVDQKTLTEVLTRGGIGAADVKAVMDGMRGKVPVGIVNKEIAGSAVWQEKLKGYGEIFDDG